MECVHCAGALYVALYAAQRVHRLIIGGEQQPSEQTEA